MRLSRTAYSYRDDPAVPDFPDHHPLIVFDGVCVLCSGFARFVIRRDPEAVFRLTTAQSALGEALYRHYGLDPTEYETNIVIADGVAYGELHSAAQVLARLPAPWRWLRVMGWIPDPVGGWLYRRVALNRYRLFGKTDTCMIPPPAWQERFIE